MTDRPRPALALMLIMNSGSSSLRFGLYDARDEALRCVRQGQIDHVGADSGVLRVHDNGVESKGRLCPPNTTARDCMKALVAWLASDPLFSAIQAIGHRIVHGMGLGDMELVSDALMVKLAALQHLAPDHMPEAIALIGCWRESAPGVRQWACFDTSFHREMPRVAQLMAIPPHAQTHGIRRFGFHGLSCTHLVHALRQKGGDKLAHGRVVLAHLGQGASLTAVHGGQSQDTTMGMTPSGGVPMGTRSGDIDPGLVGYLNHVAMMDVPAFDTMVNHQSGLLGLSGVSADMRELLAAEADNPRAADAVAVFCYQVKKAIGALAAVLGGIDTLVFSGGIGENAPAVRARICAGLGFLGIELDPALNAQGRDKVSRHPDSVGVWVMPTDEALVIARALQQYLHTLPSDTRHTP